MLRNVARSFALSLQVLPSAVRWPVALAYLMARASDTIADAQPADPGALDAADRLRALEQLRVAILSAASGAGFEQHLPPIHVIVPHVAVQSEQLLLQRLPEWLTALQALPSGDRRLIAEVCDTIISGQRMDLERFEGPFQTRHVASGLATPSELDDYTWRVAGCVGDFWSRICEMHIPEWRNTDLDTMIEDGIAYGKALQRLNILRDSADDLAMGRCYWPAQELAEAGLSATSLAEAVAHQDASVLLAMAPLQKRWIAQTRRGLATGLVYNLQLKSWRLRAASALPALIGLGTLQDMERAGTSALWQRIKWPRSQVRWVLWRLVTGGLTTSGLQGMAIRLGAAPEDLKRPALDGTMCP
jgi:farnesyl-diphosphate farnesyltransferase